MSNEKSSGRSPSVVSAQKKLSTRSETLRINGVPYRFEFEGSDIHLMTVPANRRITVTLKRLPLYLCTCPIIEQVLRPYCALDSTTYNMDTMDDPSEFTCMARAQHGVSFPAHKVLKVRDDGFGNTSTEFAAFLSGYTVRFQSENYSDGSPINHCERKKPDCFISCAKRDYGLISRLSDMVILHPQQGSVLVHLQNLEILSGGINFISERLQKLNQFAFLLSIAQPLQSHTLLQATANRKQTGTKQICPV